MMHPMVSGRAFNTPLLVDARKAEAFLQGFGDRLLGSFQVEGAEGGDLPGDAAKPLASLLDDSLEMEIMRGGYSGYAIQEGVAVIPVTGVLVHRGAWIGKSSGQTSYEGLLAQLNAAAADSSVRAIALEIDSYGGEVAGCFDLSDRIRAIRADKPVWAFATEHAYSAAYSIASQADRIIMPRTGGVGSIGVICMHADFSGALKDAGVKVTIIKAGMHKADGNPYEALPKAVRDELTARMEMLRGIFAETVGAGRGARLDAAGALATEAACFDSSDAVAAGLVDEISDPRAAFRAFVDEINGRGPAGRRPAGALGQQQRSHSMTKTPATTRPAAAQEDPEDIVPVETPDEAPAEDDGDEAPSAAAPAATTEPAASNAGSERARISAILNSEEAQGRDQLARHLAFETDMSPEAAAGVLKASAKEAGESLLNAAMTGDDTDLSDGGADRAEGPSMKEVMAARYKKPAA